jgi:hypothetical protein
VACIIILNIKLEAGNVANPQNEGGLDEDLWGNEAIDLNKKRLSCGTGKTAFLVLRESTFSF